MHTYEKRISAEISVLNIRSGLRLGNMQSQFFPTSPAKFPALGVHMAVFENAQSTTKAAHRILRDSAFRVFCHQNPVARLTTS